MNSLHLKTAVMAYFRFRKRWPYISTECGDYNADVVASDGSHHLVEVEVKCTRSDFLADFVKAKHRNYAINDPGRWTPSKFYFAVPEALEEFALKTLEEYPRYGLIVVTAARLDDCVRVAKKAEALHQRHVDRQALVAMLLRNTSDLVMLYIKREVENAGLRDYLGISTSVVRTELEMEDDL